MFLASSEKHHMDEERKGRFFAWGSQNQTKNSLDFGEGQNQQRECEVSVSKTKSAATEQVGSAPGCGEAESSQVVARETPKQRELIGEGKYGKVYRDSEGVVVKEVRAKLNIRGMTSPFREKVAAILQSLLVMHSVNPHFPLHFGFDCTPIPRIDKLDLSYYIEEFDTALDKVSHEILGSDPEAWLCAIFQLMSAIYTYSHIFQIVHNDLYPRNVLVKNTKRKERFQYNIFGARYCHHCSFMLAVTDFGLCGSPLLQSKENSPEVSASLSKKSYESGRFGKLSPTKHILYYKALPPFARDIYTVLKWIVYPPRNFAHAPRNVARWCTNALDNVDKNERHFDTPKGIAKIFDFMFSEGELAAFGFENNILRS